MTISSLKSKQRVTPDVEPGYLRDLIPKEAPARGEQWDDIFKDFETKIMPGVKRKNTLLIRKFKANPTFFILIKYSLIKLLDHSLATPALSCLLSGWKLLPVNNWRDALGWPRHCGLLLGGESFLHRARDHSSRLARSHDQLAQGLSALQPGVREQQANRATRSYS